MSSMALWYKLLHVAAALWMTAGVFGSAVVRMQTKRASSTAQRVLGYRVLWRLHVVYTLPGLVVAGLIGFYLVTAMGYRFAEIWVAASSFLYLLAFLAALFVVTPALRRLHGAAEAASRDEAAAPAFEALAGGKLWGIVSDVIALVILVLVYLMILKP